MKTKQFAVDTWVICVLLLTVAGCQRDKAVSQTSESEALSVCDKAIEDEIKLKHGDGIFTELHEVARLQWQAKLRVRSSQ